MPVKIRARPNSYQILWKNQNEARETCGRGRGTKLKLKHCCWQTICCHQLMYKCQWMNNGFERQFISNPTGNTGLTTSNVLQKVNNSNKVWNQIFGACVEGSLLTYMRALWLLPRWNNSWTKSEISSQEFPKNPFWRHLWLLGLQIKSEKKKWVKTGATINHQAASAEMQKNLSGHMTARRGKLRTQRP